MERSPDKRQDEVQPRAIPRRVRRAIEAELLEDSHFGSGTGGGGIDALVARDRAGNPVIWATHLKGVLRDTAWSLEGEPGAAFFGTRGRTRSRILLTSLYLSQDQPSSETRIWRSSARQDFDNRAPKEETLRAIEFVPRGTRFFGEIELAEDDIGLLERRFGQLTALGQGRASGAGRLKLTLKEVGAPPAPRSIEGSPGKRLLLLLRNRDPVCIAATSVPGNLIPTAPFIPGRAVLGVIAAWLLEQGKPDAAKALVDGTLSVSDALPIHDDALSSQLSGAEFHLSDAQVLPAPLALQSRKPEGGTDEVPWWASDESPSITRVNALAPPTWESEDGAGSRLKRPEADLVVYRLGGGPWRTLRPTIRVRLRNGRSNPYQEEPDLFAVEQIAEGTCFLAEIRGAVAELTTLARELAPVLEGRRWLWIGRGGAPVEVARAAWAAASTAQGITITTGYLTFTSDVLVRDDRLRWLTRLQPEDFNKHFVGWPQDVEVTDVRFQDEVKIHGFNGTARLRRLPAAGIRRGSTFKVEGAGVAMLAQQAANGQWLGERCSEGFGRFRIDATDAKLPGEGQTDETDKGKTVSDAPEEAIVVRTSEWAEDYLRLAKGVGEAPSKSQWNDLIAELETSDKPEVIDSRLNLQTAGGAVWKTAAAKQILAGLKGVETKRAIHARYFLRTVLARGGRL